MRLWHKDLIPVLPRKQLIGQWRECCLIAKNIAEKGTPNHILVNRIMEYSLEQFIAYGSKVYDEIERRSYNADFRNLVKYFEIVSLPLYIIPNNELFKYWHNKRYLDQCLYNLEEKYDCGGITDEEWHIMIDYLKVNNIIDFE